jgi:regulator of protease activity HflC (stomatin/prohibitin superfamily)
MHQELIQRRGALHLADEDEPSPADSLSAPPHVVELLPESVCRENLVFPLKLDGRTLHVAAADPSNVLLSDKLSFLTNKNIRLVRFPPDAIRDAINRHYGTAETESVDSMLVEFTDTDVTMTGVHAGLSERGRRLRAERAAPDDEDDDLDAMLAEPRPAAVSRSPRRGQDFISADGQDTTPDYGTETMWYYTVEEGQRALRIRRDGRIDVIVGPKRVWKGASRFERMRHFVAHPGDFLAVRFRDGRQEHVLGPTDVWFDPRVHERIDRQEALQLAAKEAVVVYSRATPGQDEPAGRPGIPTDGGVIARRLVYGPTLFVPAPGEWLHTFQWHGSRGGSQGVKKVAKGLTFQKLWLMPDQMYHDVPDVRTADDAVLTVRLMIFFELIDIERMLEATHDPIGDFVNAATSDAVDFVGRRKFEEFKQDTGKLNEIETYRQLTARASQNGYRVNKVVYRGYGAPDRLQQMHDQAIEARTKLQLERATEQQAQDLEDFKLTAQMNRAGKRRTEQTIEVEAELELSRKRQEAEARQREAERTAAREHRRRDAETEQELKRQAEERTRLHLAALKDMGVDLTAFLTQGRADRVIELRGKGTAGTHVHLDGTDGTGA